MVVEIKILNDDGIMVSEHRGAVQTPVTFRTPYEKPIESGDYLIFGFTYQPIVVLNPNRHKNAR